MTAALNWFLQFNGHFVRINNSVYTSIDICLLYTSDAADE